MSTYKSYPPFKCPCLDSYPPFKCPCLNPQNIGTQGLQRTLKAYI